MSLFMSLRTKLAVAIAAAGLALAAAVWTFCALSPARETGIKAGPSRGPATESRKNPFPEAGAPDRGWPTIRGPELDGRSPEIHLADSWPPDGPPVLWTRPLGQGYSAFVAAEDRVFT